MEKNIFFIEGELVGVLTTEPINRFLDYYAPIGGVSVGDFVEVNLGPRKVIGCVWSKGNGEYDSAKIKQINRVLDITPMKQEMRSFL
jgi:primosomal protein N' (replication factor Y)